MTGAPDHPKIVDGKPRVQRLDALLYQLAHMVELCVVGDDGVIMDTQMDAVPFPAVPFNVVNDVVASHGVFPHIHFHVHRGKPLSGTIVMDHQIVKSQDLLTLENLISNQLSQGGICGLSQ